VGLPAPPGLAEHLQELTLRVRRDGAVGQLARELRGPGPVDRDQQRRRVRGSEYSRAFSTVNHAPRWLCTPPFQDSLYPVVIMSGRGGKAYAIAPGSWHGHCAILQPR
jgi:hypothetical protein